MKIMGERGTSRDAERKKILFRIRKSVYNDDDRLTKGNQIFETYSTLYYLYRIVLLTLLTTNIKAPRFPAAIMTVLRGGQISQLFENI